MTCTNQECLDCPDHTEWLEPKYPQFVKKGMIECKCGMADDVDVQEERNERYSAIL